MSTIPAANGVMPAPATPPESLATQLSRQRTPSRLASSQDDFSAAIARARGGETDMKQKTRQAAEDFVSAAFVQPLLKQLRETNNAPPPFAPGQGEKMFRQIADAQLSRQLVRKSRWGLVDKVARTLLDKAEGRVAPHPMPRYGPHLDKIRPPAKTDKTPDDHATRKPELDTQA